MEKCLTGDALLVFLGWGAKYHSPSVGYFELLVETVECSRVGCVLRIGVVLPKPAAAFPLMEWYMVYFCSVSTFRDRKEVNHVN